MRTPFLFVLLIAALAGTAGTASGATWIKGRECRYHRLTSGAAKPYLKPSSEAFVRVMTRDDFACPSPPDVFLDRKTRQIVTYRLIGFLAAC
jgi:hypothetical protein